MIQNKVGGLLVLKCLKENQLLEFKTTRMIKNKVGQSKIEVLLKFNHDKRVVIMILFTREVDLVKKKINYKYLKKDNLYALLENFPLALIFCKGAI